MHFYQVVIKNIFRRKTRSLLTGLGVATSIAAVVALMGVTDSFESSWEKVYETRGVDMMVVRAGVADPLNSHLEDVIGKRIANIEHVEKVIPTLMDRVSFEEGSLVSIPLNGWPPGSYVFSTLRITAGRTLRESDQYGVLLGAVLAKNLEKKPGDEVDIELDTFQVIGIYETDNIFDNGSAVIPLATLQEIMLRENNVSEFQVMLDAEARQSKEIVKHVAEQIENLQNEQSEKLGLDAFPTNEFVENSTQVRLAKAMTWVTCAIAITLGCVGMVNTMIMSVLERTQEIGILRAIGWPQRRIVRMILGESLVLSISGAAGGILGAMLLIQILSRFPGAQGMVQGSISLLVLGFGFALAALIGLAGGAYPAWLGAQRHPTEALRYEE